LDAKDKPAFKNKFMMFIAKSLMGTMVQDARAHVDSIRQSDLDWTVVRAPMLTDQSSQGPYRVGYLNESTGSSASRSDVAAFILDVLMKDKYVKQMPLISS
jgi:putative NADH-flavin reductase